MIKLSKLIDIFANHAAFLDNVPLGTAKEERQLARNWIETAGEFLENQEYFKKERDKLLKKYEPDNVLLKDDGH